MYIKLVKFVNELSARVAGNRRSLSGVSLLMLLVLEAKAKSDEKFDVHARNEF